ncbi:hypothetical protein [Bifidobacterium moukalabense]|uniref:hypothetical protein n=1 Tax=Bifidobacterium moukalabense TaxID=1333651 RepID=UPI0010F68DA6|nr:hypothetical protein [Bifidobacterium moukalabense]
MKTQELLKKIANEHAAELCELGDSVSDKSLKKGSYYKELSIDGGNTYLVVRAAAISAGTVIVDEKEKGQLAVLLKSGVGKLAPVLLVAMTKEDKVELGCYSKEGLIPQHAAEKTLKSFMAAIS